MLSGVQRFFGATSRHWYMPRAAAVRRADAEIARHRQPGVAVIGVHVRSVILLALHKERRTNVAARGVMQTYGFIDCIAKLRNHTARAAGYASSRVYVAADGPAVWAEAAAALGKDVVVPPPSYVYAGREMRGKMVTARGDLATGGAIDEMLLLARTDALVVWDLADSTYSAAAASWAVHRAGGQRAQHERSRTWLGVYFASRACERVPDADVEPATGPSF